MIDGYSLFVILRALFSACNILDLFEIQFLFCHYFGETLHTGYSTQQTTHNTHTNTCIRSIGSPFSGGSTSEPRKEISQKALGAASGMRLAMIGAIVHPVIT